MYDLSIVVPVYKCAGTIEILRERLDESLTDKNISWELILVNDCCPENSWEIIQKLTNDFVNVRGLNLSRNFGQHAAITAGLSVIKGDKVVVMDGDLQDRPEEIPKLIAKSNEGFDVVLARRVDRKDNIIKKMSSRLFYYTMSKLTGQKYDSTIANFGCYNKKVIEAVLSMGDMSRSFQLFVNWVGFKTAKVDVEHSMREIGETTYTFRKSVSLALNSMISFSNKPLKITVNIGLFLSVVAVIIGLFYFIGALKGLFLVQGWATMVISMWFLGGLTILILGVVGLYISKIFEQTKNRPIFIISEDTSKRN
ncbi:MAG: glycosyltransferase family 2 protein [Spirochaetaceae bacterium]